MEVRQDTCPISLFSSSLKPLVWYWQLALDHNQARIFFLYLQETWSLLRYILKYPQRHDLRCNLWSIQHLEWMPVLLLPRVHTWLTGLLFPCVRPGQVPAKHVFYFHWRKFCLLIAKLNFPDMFFQAILYM